MSGDGTTKKTKARKKTSSAAKTKPKAPAKPPVEPKAKAPTTKRSGAVSASQVRAEPPPDVPSTADSLAAARAFLIGVAPQKPAAKQPAAKKPAPPPSRTTPIEVAADPESDPFDLRDTIPVPHPTKRGGVAVAPIPAPAPEVDADDDVDDTAKTLVPPPAPSGEQIADEIRELDRKSVV